MWQCVHLFSHCIWLSANKEPRNGVIAGYLVHREPAARVHHRIRKGTRTYIPMKHIAVEVFGGHVCGCLTDTNRLVQAAGYWMLNNL